MFPLFITFTYHQSFFCTYWGLMKEFLHIFFQRKASFLFVIMQFSIKKYIVIFTFLMFVFLLVLCILAKIIKLVPHGHAINLNFFWLTLLLFIMHIFNFVIIFSASLLTLLIQLFSFLPFSCRLCYFSVSFFLFDVLFNSIHTFLNFIQSIEQVFLNIFRVLFFLSPYFMPTRILSAFLFSV